MYDIKQRNKAVNATVGDIIDYLQTLPQETEVLLCGDNRFYMHLEKDKSVVNFDTEDLDAEYIEDPETNEKDYWENVNELRG